MLSSLFRFIILALASVSYASPAKKDLVCNGHAELCSRSYGNVTYIGAHDSYAHSYDPLLLGRDQTVDIPTQLSLGVRLLQAQSHLNNGVIHFCHTSCEIFDGGPVVDYLATVKTFLDDNPNEVLTFIFTNPEGLSMNGVWLPAFQDSGIDTYAYVPSHQPLGQSGWPTLGSLIESGNRLITFMDYGADTPGDTVPFIISEFPNVWETPYDSTDPSFPCSVNRTAGPLSNADHMYMINHFLDINILGTLLPDEAAAPNTNGVTSILADANGCTHFANGRAPNFVLLDWVDQGQAFAAADILNGFA